MLELNKENFFENIEKSPLPVVVDLWGPQCVPCLALMPDVEKLAAEYEGKAIFGKINVTENRRLCISLKVMSVPTFLFYKKGELQSRLSADEVTLEAIQEHAAKLIAG